jgi:hypothetical protein
MNSTISRYIRPRPSPTHSADRWTMARPLPCLGISLVLHAMAPRNHRTFSASWPGPFVARAVIIISMTESSRSIDSLNSTGGHPSRQCIHPQTIQKGGSGSGFLLDGTHQGHPSSSNSSSLLLSLHPTNPSVPGNASFGAEGCRSS